MVNLVSCIQTRGKMYKHIIRYMTGETVVELSLTFFVKDLILIIGREAREIIYLVASVCPSVCPTKFQVSCSHFEAVCHQLFRCEHQCGEGSSEQFYRGSFLIIIAWMRSIAF